MLPTPKIKPLPLKKKYQQPIRFKPKVSLITFTVYLLSDDSHVLTPVTAFVCLTLFDILKLPLVLLPMLVVYIVQVNTALGKGSTFRWMISQLACKEEEETVLMLVL